MSEHFTKKTPTELTDHERTVIMIALTPGLERDRKIGELLAYNEDWRLVFKKRSTAKLCSMKGEKK